MRNYKRFLAVLLSAAMVVGNPGMTTMAAGTENSDVSETSSAEDTASEADDTGSSDDGADTSESSEGEDNDASSEDAGADKTESAESSDEANPEDAENTSSEDDGLDAAEEENSEAHVDAEDSEAEGSDTTDADIDETDSEEAAEDDADKASDEETSDTEETEDAEDPEEAQNAENAEETAQSVANDTDTDPADKTDEAPAQSDDDDDDASVSSEEEETEEEETPEDSLDGLLLADGMMLAADGKVTVTYTIKTKATAENYPGGEIVLNDSSSASTTVSLTETVDLDGNYISDPEEQLHGAEFSTYKGFTFLGWYLDGEFDGDDVSGDSKLVSENEELDAETIISKYLKDAADTLNINALVRENTYDVVFVKSESDNSELGFVNGTISAEDYKGLGYTELFYMPAGSNFDIGSKTIRGWKVLDGDYKGTFYMADSAQQASKLSSEDEDEVHIAPIYSTDAVVLTYDGGTFGKVSRTSDVIDVSSADAVSGSVTATSTNDNAVFRYWTYTDADGNQKFYYEEELPQSVILEAAYSQTDKAYKSVSFNAVFEEISYSVIYKAFSDSSADSSYDIGSVKYAAVTDIVDLDTLIEKTGGTASQFSRPTYLSLAGWDIYVNGEKTSSQLQSTGTFSRLTDKSNAEVWLVARWETLTTTYEFRSDTSICLFKTDESSQGQNLKFEVAYDAGNDIDWTASELVSNPLYKGKKLQISYDNGQTYHLLGSEEKDAEIGSWGLDDAKRQWWYQPKRDAEGHYSTSVIVLGSAVENIFKASFYSDGKEVTCSASDREIGFAEDDSYTWNDVTFTDEAYYKNGTASTGGEVLIASTLGLTGSGNYGVTVNPETGNRRIFLGWTLNKDDLEKPMFKDGAFIRDAVAVAYDNSLLDYTDNTLKLYAVWEDVVEGASSMLYYTVSHTEDVDVGSSRFEEKYNGVFLSRISEAVTTTKPTDASAYCKNAEGSTFNPENGPAASKDMKIGYDSTDKPGTYYFVGWFDQEAYNNKDWSNPLSKEFKYTPEREADGTYKYAGQTVYAIVGVVPHVAYLNIHYEYNGDNHGNDDVEKLMTYDDSEKFTYGGTIIKSKVAALNATSKNNDGYYISGWYTNEARTDRFVFEDDDDSAGTKTRIIDEYLHEGEGIDAYAVWSPTPNVLLTYTQVGNGNAYVKNQEEIKTSEEIAKNGTPAGAIAVADTGYHFVKWTGMRVSDSSEITIPDSAVNTKLQTLDPQPTATDGTYENATYTAVFEPNHYSIVYVDEDGQTITVEDAESYEDIAYDAELTIPGLPEKEGVKAQGWQLVKINDDEVENGRQFTAGQKVSSLTATDGAVITLKAAYGRGDVDITFGELDGVVSTTSHGTIYKLTEGDASDTVVAWESLTKAGYIVDTDGNVTDEELFGVTAVPKTGYNFAGWYITLGGTKDPEDAIQIAGSDAEILTADMIRNAIKTQSGSSDLVTAHFWADFSSQKYQIIFHGQGGVTDDGLASAVSRTDLEGLTDDDDTTYTQTGFVFGSDKEIASNLFTRKNYSFTGWTEDKNSNTATIKDLEKINSVTKDYEYDEEEALGTGHLYATWVKYNYKVVFHKNHPDEDGESGSMDDEIFDFDEEKSLTDNSFTRKSYDFTGWNTKEDGTGTAYTDEQVVMNLTDEPNGVVDLYAQWEKSSYKVVFHKNHPDEEGESGTMEDEPFEFDEEKALTDNTYTRKKAEFIGWNTKEDGTGTAYTDEQVVVNLTDEPNGVVDLYAQWKNYNYTVHFEKNHEDETGESGSMDDETFEFDEEKSLTDNDFTRKTYHFVKWNTEPDGSGVSYTDEQIVKNLTDIPNGVVNLYAQWERTGSRKGSSSGGSGGGSGSSGSSSSGSSIVTPEEPTGEVTVGEAPGSNPEPVDVPTLLPQTGAVWWPMLMLLAVAAVSFVAALAICGVSFRRKSSR